MTIKELKNHPELLKHITADLDDLDDNMEVVFEVYAFGYDVNWQIVEASMCMFNSIDPTDALKAAEEMELMDVVDMMPYEEDYNQPGQTAHITIEVESVVEIDDECVNLGTIYNRDIWR
jgi:hypothetical protein